MDKPSLGAIIWISLRPLIRLILTTLFGFIITKADIFPMIAAKGAGQIMLNITLPCLMFSKIVPSFDQQNIGALGPLVSMALIYEGLGLTIAWIIKRICWVPHRFRYGILCAGAFSNYSDIPTAVIMSITGSLPFNPVTDQNLSVAYIAALVLVLLISLFPVGGYRFVEMDYVGPDVEDDDLRMSMAAKTRQTVAHAILYIRCIPFFPRQTPFEAASSAFDMEKSPSFSEANKDQTPKRTDEEEPSSDTNPEVSCAPVEYTEGQVSRPKQVSFLIDDATAVSLADGAGAGPAQSLPVDRDISRLTSPEPSIFHSETPTVYHPTDDYASSPLAGGPSPQPAQITAVTATANHPRIRTRVRVLRAVRPILRNLLLPPSLTILASFLIAFVAPLKALFTPVVAAHIPNAPDGQPPLAFVLDTASFVGAASIPLGLICLGSALARLELPSVRAPADWARLPLAAISLLALGKMVLVPVLGVLIVNGFVSVGFIDKEDKVLRFVCVFFSCVPTATTQVFLAQVYSGTGTAGVLPAFLVPQYFLMIFSMTILTAYMLSTLF